MCMNVDLAERMCWSDIASLAQGHTQPMLGGYGSQGAADY